MADARIAVHTNREEGTTTNKVLRNTYMLLSMTLLFSAAMTAVSIAINAPYMGFMPLLVSFALLFAISKFKNSSWGIALVFAFTGILGFSLGPIIGFYLQTSGGSEAVMTSIGLTGVIFLSLSGYTLTTQKDFSFMRGFLFTGLMVVIGAMLLIFVGSFFGLYISGLQLALSAAIVMLMSGFILFDTSRIIHNGETNYIMATVALYLDIYNLFVALLSLVVAFSGDD